MLLQHVDFQSFSVENLLRIGRCTLSGPTAEELHREVGEALKSRKRKPVVRSSQDFQPKRRCLKHWTPDLGASIEASWQEVWPLQCISMKLYKGHIYAMDFARNVHCWNPSDPATRAQRVVGQAVGTTGITDLGHDCELAVSPTGEILVMDDDNGRLVRFKDGCGHFVCYTSGSSLFCYSYLCCSPEGVIYLAAGQEEAQKGKVQKLVGSTFETLIDSENLPQDLQFSPSAIFVTKDEVIYITTSKLNRILRINPAESLEPVLVGQIPDLDEDNSDLCGLFVTEGETIYVSETRCRKVFVFRRGDGTPSEVFQCPDPILYPLEILVRGRSLYVSAVDDCVEPTAGGVYELLLPPELQLD